MLSSRGARKSSSSPEHSEDEPREAPGRVRAWLGLAGRRRRAGRGRRRALAGLAALDVVVVLGCLHVTSAPELAYLPSAVFDVGRSSSGAGAVSLHQQEGTWLALAVRPLDPTRPAPALEVDRLRLSRATRTMGLSVDSMLYPVERYSSSRPPAQVLEPEEETSHGRVEPGPSSEEKERYERAVSMEESKDNSSRAAEKLVAELQEGPTGEAGAAVNEQVARKVSFHTAGVGGSSGGLMLALARVDAWSAGDLSGGRRVAGTGTIAWTGQVGEIGGLAEKIELAVATRAHLVLVPQAQEREARAALERTPGRAGVVLRGVASLEEAVAAVCQTRPEQQESPEICERVELHLRQERQAAVAAAQELAGRAAERPVSTHNR